jgi:hypothetical protein
LKFVWVKIYLYELKEFKAKNILITFMEINFLESFHTQKGYRYLKFSMSRSMTRKSFKHFKSTWEFKKFINILPDELLIPPFCENYLWWILFCYIFSCVLMAYWKLHDPTSFFVSISPQQGPSSLSSVKGQIVFISNFSSRHEFTLFI